jgi:hypothetical protein
LQAETHRRVEEESLEKNRVIDLDCTLIGPHEAFKQDSEPGAAMSAHVPVASLEMNEASGRGNGRDVESACAQRTGSAGKTECDPAS